MNKLYFDIVADDAAGVVYIAPRFNAPSVTLRGCDARDFLRVLDEKRGEGKAQAYVRACHAAALPLEKKEG